MSSSQRLRPTAARHLKRREEAGRIRRPVLYGHRRIVLEEDGAETGRTEIEVG